MTMMMMMRWCKVVPPDRSRGQGHAIAQDAFKCRFRMIFCTCIQMFCRNSHKVRQNRLHAAYVCVCACRIVCGRRNETFRCVITHNKRGKMQSTNETPFTCVYLSVRANMQAAEEVLREREEAIVRTARANEDRILEVRDSTHYTSQYSTAQTDNIRVVQAEEAQRAAHRSADRKEDELRRLAERSAHAHTHVIDASFLTPFCT